MPVTRHAYDAPFVDKINIEFSSKRILGPFNTLPSEVVVSPVYIVPKNSPGKFRLIHNLSSPKTDSVNNHINLNMCSVKYCSILDVASFLMTNSGTTWHMAKVDLKDAYRCIPVHREEWRFLGMRYKESIGLTPPCQWAADHLLSFSPK